MQSNFIVKMKVFKCYFDLGVATRSSELEPVNAITIKLITTRLILELCGPCSVPHLEPWPVSVLVTCSAIPEIV